MIPAHVVEITTPNNYRLNGLWFGPKRPKRVVVWVHGLGSSMFSKIALMSELVDANTAVLAFNNRGSDRVVQLRKRSGNNGKRLLAGAGHERFIDCVDDIEGALRTARKSGAKKIFLAGHSTGSQKSIYWAAKKGKGVKGIILLAPVSDYAAALKQHGAAKLARIARYARTLVQRGRSQELIPHAMWQGGPDDAQRFLSLYTPDSVEEIFMYAQPKKRPKLLEKIKIPTLILWAQRDEFADRPAQEIAAWFERHLKNEHTIAVVRGAGHSFRGAEKRVAKEIAKFMKEA